MKCRFSDIMPDGSDTSCLIVGCISCMVLRRPCRPARQPVIPPEPRHRECSGRPSDAAPERISRHAVFLSTPAELCRADPQHLRHGSAVRSRGALAGRQAREPVTHRSRARSGPVRHEPLGDAPRDRSPGIVHVASASSGSAACQATRRRLPGNVAAKSPNARRVPCGWRDIKILGRERFFVAQFARDRYRLARVRYLRSTLRDIPRLVLETALVLFILAFVGVNAVVTDGAVDALPTRPVRVRRRST